MNNNRRRELTVRLFLYFVQSMAVRMEKLEIGYEQKLNEGRPCFTQPLPPNVTFCHYSPSRKRTSFLNDF